MNAKFRTALQRVFCCCWHRDKNGVRLLGWSRDLHYCHNRFLPSTVFRRKLDLCSLLIMEIMAIHSWSHNTYLYGFWLWSRLCDLLEMLNFNQYRSAVTTRRNLVDQIQSRNISGLMMA
jgi:hypothetical protein